MMPLIHVTECDIGSSQRLADFRYSDLNMADLITDSVKTVEFMGMGGYIKFDEGGGVRPNVAIEQMQGEGVANPSLLC